MPAPAPASWADPFRLEPPTAARLAQALAATPAARSGPRWDSCPTPAPIRQQLRRMVAAQLLADRARRRALGLLQLAAAAPPVRLREPCSSTPAAAPPMPTPATDAELAQLWAVLLAYRRQPRAWPRPRPPYLPHPRRRLPRVRGVVRGSKP
jgi:hypothetical protein